MADSTSASEGNVLRTYERGLALYGEDEWSLAARSFDMSVNLGNQDPTAYEYLARSYLHEAQRQVQEHAVDDSRADGALAFEMATEAALKTEQKFGKERWQPSFILATILYHRQQYTLSSSHLSLSLSHPSFGAATASEQISATDLSELISIALLRLRQDNNNPQGGRIYAPSRTNIKLALSPDILLRIVDLGLEDDPGLASRLSRVCQSARRVLINQPRLWRTLILGRGLHGLLKVNTYVARSAQTEGGEGCLKEVRILPGYEWEDQAAVGKVLKAQAANIERLDVAVEGECDSQLLQTLRRSMSNLHSLTVRANKPTKIIPTLGSLDLDLLPFTSSCLQELKLYDICYEYEGFDEEVDEEDSRKPGKWTVHPAVQLRNLEILRFDGCHLVYPDDELRDLLQYTPNIKEVSIKRTVWESTGFADPPIPFEPDDDSPRLEHLTTWCTVLDPCSVYHLGQRLFASIFVPRLTRLEYNSADGHDLARILLPGIDEALPHLRSLSVRDSAIEDDCIPILLKMTSLEFLDLENCRISQDFLDEFVDETLETSPILPNLVALSLAGSFKAEDDWGTRDQTNQDWFLRCGKCLTPVCLMRNKPGTLP